MWNPFKKKRKAEAKTEQPADPDQNRINDLIERLQKEGRIEELEGELQKLDIEHYSKSEQETWWHMFGIAAFQAGNDALALSRFQEAYSKHPESGHIRFSLGQQYIRANNPTEAFELFKQCSFPEIPRDYIMFQARYAYLWGRIEEGIEFLQSFWEGYKQLKILDDHFLYVRGLPFFGTWWAYLGAFAVLSKDFTQLDNVTAHVSEHCHDYDFEHLALELEALKSNNPEGLVNRLKKRLNESSSQNFPTGYQRTQLAVFEAKAKESYEAAIQRLNEVQLESQDFPWLSDIVILAKAELASKFGKLEEEEQHVNAFIEKQPMIFEPDIAVNFHLLQYQEKLKPRVIKSDL